MQQIAMIVYTLLFIFNPEQAGGLKSLGRVGGGRVRGRGWGEELSIDYAAAPPKSSIKRSWWMTRVGEGVAGYRLRRGGKGEGEGQWAGRGLSRALRGRGEGGCHGVRVELRGQS